MKRKVLLYLIIIAGVLNMTAQTTTAPNEARQTFDKVYNMVFGPQGSTLRYDVNIIGLYKTHGTIWYKD